MVGQEKDDDLNDQNDQNDRNDRNDQGLLSSTLREAKGRFRPLNVTFELSTACNLRCTHCYNFDRKTVTRPKSERPALTPTEIKRVLFEIREAGALVVAFTGGEALLHPHLLDFVRTARALKLAVRLKSNGTLIDAAKACQLREAGVVELEVSLYGASPGSHDPFTNSPGSFASTLAAVGAAKDSGISTQINFVMHRGCAGEVADMLALAETLGVRSSLSMELTSRYDGTTDSLDERLTEEDLKNIFRGSSGHYFVPSINETDSVQCACATTNVGIGFDGTVYPCIGAPIPSGDLRQQSFSTIWHESKVFAWIRSLSLDDFKSCKPCELRPYCQRSSGAIFTNTGDYTGKEDWTCKQAELLRELSLKELNME